MPKKLFLIDGHSECYQAFYAMRGRTLNAPDGQPVNVVYIFTTMLRKILNEHHPDYVAVAFDEKGPTFRHVMYEKYKATRKTPPDEFLSQLPLVKEVLKAHGIPIFVQPGYEADDVLGTLARQAAEAGADVVLVTIDKDARQLLGPHVTMMNGRTGEMQTVETLRQTQGLSPEQVVDMMGLAGDASDNVPGIKGVGPKTAAQLIREYGTLDKVLDKAGEIRQNKLRENLLQHAETARLSRKLVTIDTHVPVTLDLEACVVHPDDSALRRLFERFGFKSLLVPLSGPTRGEHDYRPAETPEKFKSFLAELRKHKKFSFDLETTSTQPVRAEIVGMSFCWEPNHAWYLPVRAPAGQPTLDESAVVRELKPILSSAEYKKVGQNLKYDATVLMNVGCEVNGIAFDTMLASYCLDPTRRRYNLDDLAYDCLEYRKIPITDLIGKGKAQKLMSDVPVEQISEYCCEDSDMALRLAELFEPKLKETGVWDLFSDIDVPLVMVLARMEHNGVGFDAHALEELAKELGTEMRRLELEIYKEAGEEFNIGSPKQLAGILFTKLKLPMVTRGHQTKTGPSTDAEVLAELAIEHRLPSLVMQYRKLSKLQSTYVSVLPEMVNPKTGRIHASFNQTMTATGRLSSSDPNLQNIPIRTELGSQIRKAFVPSAPGWVIMAADYSQIELRILAHVSEDPMLTEAFRKGEDIHAFVASQVNGVPLDEVTPEMRRVAKAVNFGIIYGQTPYGLSRSIGIPVEDADAFIKAYFERYAGVKKFIDRVVADAREKGWVTTLRGRRRLLPELSSQDRSSRSFGERAAVNTIIQGTAADMIKIAMIRIDRELREKRLRTRMILQIHDELVFEAPQEELDVVRPMVVRHMSEAEPLRVAVKVDVGVGRNWLEAK